MLKLNYNSKVATSRNMGKKRLGERLPSKKGQTPWASIFEEPKFPTTKSGAKKTAQTKQKF
ncbi:MAG: hypothetical protein LBV23_07940 [Deltaproteobacteria bacterium]|jgi:hypothetical protein|nr:hypothetical protein [Deltaproteobacteria bacterium]